jgi:hypothetical protein
MMANIEITGKIPSSVINREFIQEIGKIIESDVHERIESAKKLPRNEKREKRNSTNNNVSDDDFINIYVSYKFKSGDTEFSFSSNEEIKNTILLPRNIKKITIYVWHHNNDYVDVNINLDLPFQMIWSGDIGGTYRLSSSNQQKLLKIKSDLENTFDNFHTDYKFILYPFPRLPYTGLSISSALLSIVTIYIMFFSNFFGAMKQDYLLLTGFVFFSFYMMYSFIMKRLFPYFIYKLSPRRNKSQILKALFVAIIVSATGSAIYDLLRGLI